jgi:hypothetical protein
LDSIVSATENDSTGKKFVHLVNAKLQPFENLFLNDSTDKNKMQTDARKYLCTNKTY